MEGKPSIEGATGILPTTTAGHCASPSSSTMSAQAEKENALSPDPSFDSSGGFKGTNSNGDSRSETLINRHASSPDEPVSSETVSGVTVSGEPVSGWHIESCVRDVGASDDINYEETEERKSAKSSACDNPAEIDFQGQASRKSTAMSGRSSILEIDKLTGELEIRESSSQLQSSSVSNPTLRKFSYSDLKCATKNFNNRSLVGKGDYGSVYKGCLPPAANSSTNSDPVVVKRFYKNSMTRRPDRLLVQINSAELDSLGRLEHPHLVQLLGYCAENDHLLLVNEYVPLGSVESHICKHGHQSKGSRQQHLPFSWDLRLKVALQAAKGLAFLHGQKPKVIHGDLKPTNILLDRDFNAKLSDFGLLKYGNAPGETNFAGRIELGYLAPDYIESGLMTMKCDVYSFGLVLLVMFSGLKATERLDGKRLIEYASTCGKWCRDKKVVMKLADNMGIPYNPIGACSLVQVISRCLEMYPECRPPMTLVVDALEYIYEHYTSTEVTDPMRGTT